MVDRFSEYEISNKVDVWMLGCVAYFIAYRKHPFEDAQKLTIINCSYNFHNSSNSSYNSSNSEYSEKYQDLIRVMLNPNSNNRPNIDQVISILDKYNSMKSIDIKCNEILDIKSKQTGVKYTRIVVKESSSEIKDMGKNENMSSNNNNANTNSFDFEWSNNSTNNNTNNTPDITEKEANDIKNELGLEFN